jgi:Zn-dependent protease
MHLLLSILLGAPPFLLAIMIHESTHALVALKLGDPTARSFGRISLDPRRHFDPIGAVLYVVTMAASGGHFGFGWAKPVPINPYNFRDRRRDFMLSSIAAPASNLAQAVMWALLLRLYASLQHAPPAITVLNAAVMHDYLGFMMFFGININVVLAVFNLIPIPPLDGSRLLAWMLPEDLAHRLDRLEPFGMIIIFALLFLGLLDVVSRVVAYPLLFFILRLATG